MKLDTIDGESTRPTADRAKESLFNIISPRIQECSFTDIFSGTGSIGCEALSRGAERVTFIDENRECLKVITDNVKKMKITEKSEIFCENYKSAVKKLQKQDIIFLDPPYNSGMGIDCLEKIERYDILKDNGIAVLEYDCGEDIPEKINKLVRYDVRKYGRCMFAFFKKDREA